MYGKMRQSGVMLAWAAALGLCALAAPARGQFLFPPKDKQPAAPPPDAGATSDLYKSSAGPFDVRTIDETWEDGARNRTVPVRIYVRRVKDAAAAPAENAKHPVIIFSHGLGGSRAIYGYFGRHMASHGYIVIAPTHAGSDTAAAVAWMRTRAGRFGTDKKGQDQATKEQQGWLTSSINDPDNLIARPRDISFAIGQIAAHGVLGPIADMDRIGVAGHSFGAYTAMAAGGMTVDLPDIRGGRAQSFRDPRVRAVLAMSPQGSGTMGISADAWNAMGVPVLCLTGTHDYGAGGRSAAWRRQAFEAIHNVDDYLITISGAGHMTFSNPDGKAGAGLAGGLGGMGGLGDGGGIGRGSGGKGDAALIQALSTAYFDAYLRGDAEAKAWLIRFCMAKRSDAVGEFKPEK